MALANDWRGDATIAPLTGNPLLLSTLLMVHHLDGSVPNGRAELYDRYIKGMLGVWDDRRKVDQPTSLALDAKRAILTDIAVEMIVGGSDQLDESNALAIVGSSLGRLGASFDAAMVLDGIRERSGLIVGPGVYSFAHKTIGEFLVAEAVLNGDRDLPDGSRLDSLKLFDCKDKDEWNTVVFLWAGIAPVATVEMFTKQLGDAGDAALALGLFLDQYDRFVPSIRKRIYDRLEPSLNQLKFDRTTRNVAGRLAAGTGLTLGEVRPFCNGSISIPTSTLRGITSSFERRLRALIDRLIDDKIILADSLQNFSAPVRYIVWHSAIISNNSRSALRRLLGAIPYTRNARSRRLFWLLEWHLARSWSISGLQGKAIPPTDIIQELTSYERKLLPLVPIAILSASVRRMSSLRTGTTAEHVSRRARVAMESARLLMQPGNGTLAGEYLQATKLWDSDEFLPPDQKDLDLLRHYRSFLLDVSSKQTDDALASAISWCTELMMRRDASVTSGA